MELIIYNDSRHGDEQTSSIRGHCDHFLDVFEKTDAQLHRFIGSHQLDVLVELAGHTSFNRLPLLQKRMARLQVTGIGYPVTTGLRAIDAKMLDPFILTQGASRYYAEQPLVLPQSFWCFDPMVDVPLAQDPPCIKAGAITFGCYGNISKINEKIIRCWGSILQQVPGSKLLLQSVNFDEPTTLSSLLQRLIACGLQADRLQLRGSVRGSDYYRSYDDVDIILDTHPFNGGTTTCFAVYMGTPVVSMHGQSIVSRMGHTVLHNVGAPQLSVGTLEEYVSRAVELACDIPYLRRFRQEARLRMRQTSLGDGRQFARDFESACRDHLAAQEAGESRYVPTIDTLPPVELVRRAGQILAAGNRDACVRITQYCLQHYPAFGPAHILATEEFTRSGDFAAAAEYLQEKADQCTGADKVAMYINIVRFWVLAGDFDRAQDAMRTLEALPSEEPLDILQISLCKALLTPMPLAPRTGEQPTRGMVGGKPRKARCIIPCNDADDYRAIVQHLTKTCLPTAGWEIAFVRCDEMARARVYQTALQDGEVEAVLFLRKNVAVLSPRFFLDILQALEMADVVGYGGGLRWTRFDWSNDDFSQRAWGLLSPSGEKPGLLDVNVSGLGREVLLMGAAMLAGDCMAVRAGRQDYPAFDPDLLEGGELLEQMWSYQAGRAGLRLAIHRNLGIFAGLQDIWNDKYAATVRLQLVEKMGFDVFDLQRDTFTLTMPCRSVDEGLAVMDCYLSGELLQPQPA